MFHEEHMISGVRAALASPKTPKHLKTHLAQRLETMNPKKNNRDYTPEVPNQRTSTGKMPITKAAPKKKGAPKPKVTNPADAFYGR
jgi:hypothetical protein